MNFKPRMLGWIVCAFTLMSLCIALKPGLSTLTLFKLSLMSLAAVSGYWLDRTLFPYARPDKFLTAEPHESELLGSPLRAPSEQALDAAALIFCACMLRRALILLGCLLAVALGV